LLLTFCEGLEFPASEAAEVRARLDGSTSECRRGANGAVTMDPAVGPDKLKEPNSSSGARRSDVGAAGDSAIVALPTKLVLFTDEEAAEFWRSGLRICPANVTAKMIFPETGRLLGAMAKSSEIKPIHGAMSRLRHVWKSRPTLIIGSILDGFCTWDIEYSKKPLVPPFEFTMVEYLDCNG
jgi:hypothetical protein